MRDHTNLSSLRHRAGRWAVLAGATLAISLFPGAAAHAGDGGLLDDVTDVAGAVTEPVVDPALETVETVVEPVEQAVEPVVEDVVEPTVSEVEQAADEVTDDEGVTPPERPDPATRDDDGPTGRPDSGPGEQAAGPVTAAQPAAATPTSAPADDGSGDAAGAADRGDGSGSAAADGPRGGKRPSAAPCDGVDDLPARGAAAPVVDRGGRTSDAEVAGASRSDARSGDDPGRGRALDLPEEGGPVPALVAPDPSRALWLTGLVALVLTLTAGLTVVLVRELE